MSAKDDGVRKIGEKSEKARREFFKKTEKIVKSHGHSNKLMQDTADRAALEYNKVFGRIGVHPLLHLKNGKKVPRYLLDRDEVWVLYKPPLWQCGGKEDLWRRNIEGLVRTHSSLNAAQEEMIAANKASVLQEWHGLTQGMMWIDRDQEVMNWGFIQRLDVETDGPIIIAKTWRNQKCLQAQMKDHVFSKAYMCLVHGRLENRIHHVKTRFAELGSDAQTAVMLKHDNENDPFYEWSVAGRWKGRNVRQAESFFKPLAYYSRKEDGQEYSLVYVNILTGITHQVRITLQSVGHPLVSDDRYLPKDQAIADLKWCPRNFLTEVRSDWFDFCGPHKDEARRHYTRVSMENPLPKHLQVVLENKLDLVEKLDATADLFVGTQYWNLGDEQLINAYPKDDEYRRKVTRWCQRRHIHLDGIDRLLLLPKEDIDAILQNYKSGTDRLDNMWVCTECMNLNNADGMSQTPLECTGAAGSRECPGTRIVDEEHEIAKGYMDFSADPTFHFLLLINKRYLDARRKVLKVARPSWEKPPPESEGSVCTSDILLSLEAALVLNAKSGGTGIVEEDLLKVPGLEDVKLPLESPPEDSNIQRVRLPGKGVMSQWLYTLKGKVRITHMADFCVKTKKLLTPVPVKTESIPSKMVLTKAEKEKKEKQQARVAEKLRAQNETMKLSLLSEDDQLASATVAVKKEKKKWVKKESTSNPGHFYYVNTETGKTEIEQPADYEDEGTWTKVESKSNRGQFYYYNSKTGETSIEKPKNGIVKEEVKEEVKVKEETKVKEEEEEDDGIPWERRESKTRPGNFFYFNPVTGANEIHPPRVDPPWKLLESKTKKGQFYYFNEETGESGVNPPKTARAATRPSAETLKRPSGEPMEARRVAAKVEKLPAGWSKKESDKYAGKFYYVNAKTGETSWTRPSEWERQESKSNPGTYYYVNTQTGETSWDKKVANGK